ncbi:hypothetical protein AAFP30_04705 [Gordonia sp. CPCC 205515]|uniref:hypothetical protein n=1 Tax=Gordonia sp. CPCC 205515 TaxID=3140791 RepID=UPI003AF3E98E
MAQRKRFNQLPPRSRALIIVGATVQIVLQGIALRDLKNRPVDQVNGPKKAWAAASFINYFGPIAYLAVGRKKK